MGRIFDMNNKFFRFMSKVADLCILNIICVVCCIPVITAGASITAMYYVTLKMVRNEEAYIVRSFFKSFKQNFKQATIINLIMLLIGLVLYVDLNVSKAMQGGAGQIFHVIFMAFALIYFILFLYVYPVLARFYNTIKNTIKNALIYGNPSSSVYGCHGAYCCMPAVTSACEKLSDTVDTVCTVSAYGICTDCIL